MKRLEFSYCLLRYVHDPRAGEALNLGVLVYCEELRRVFAQFEVHYDRMSSAFRGFDGDHYRSLIRRLDRGINRLNAEIGNSLFSSGFSDVSAVFRSLVPDSGLSLQQGHVFYGVSDDIEAECARLFDLLVSSQAPLKQKKSRTDDEVWSVFSRRLVARNIVKYLQPREFSSGENNWKFDHTFKNEKWHILEPATMDYAAAERLQQKAAKLVGETTILSDNQEIGKIYILLGAPRQDGFQNAYIKAKNLLNKIPIPKILVEEHEAEDFAAELASFMVEHGVIESNGQPFDSGHGKDEIKK